MIPTQNLGPRLVIYFATDIHLLNFEHMLDSLKKISIKYTNHSKANAYCFCIVGISNIVIRT